jgi:hypothetical protein
MKTETGDQSARQLKEENKTQILEWKVRPKGLGPQRNDRGLTRLEEIRKKFRSLKKRSRQPGLIEDRVFSTAANRETEKEFTSALDSRKETGADIDR